MNPRTGDVNRVELRARAAVRFVFRRYPDLLRAAGSTYERRKRAAARRRQLAEQAASTESEVTQA